MYKDKNTINYLLLPLSAIFYILLSIRKVFYKLGVFRTYNSSKPVIVVGNITTGGTGKTPMVIELVKFFQAKGKKVGVVSRGYGRIIDDSSCIIVDDKTNVMQVGDEPMLIYKQTNCMVSVNANRVSCIKKIQNKVDIIISDDGLQHYAMSRDIEIVLTRGFGNGFLLPAGNLRETKSRLKSVDFVLDDYARKLKNIAFINGKTGEKKPLNYFANIKCVAVCGIARPQLFFDNLKLLNIDFEEKPFADHYIFKAADLKFTKPVITTAKDWVKYKDYATINMWYLSVKIEIPYDFYNKLEQKLCLMKKY